MLPFSIGRWTFTTSYHFIQSISLHSSLNSKARDCDPAAPLLLTKAQLARELQCSQRHIERLQSAGRIPVIRLSAKCVRYRRENVLAALLRLETVCQ
jgi:hypothetical protein